MEPIAYLVKVSVPTYLSNLPIPNSIGGWFRLGVRDWLSLIPPTAALAGLGYMSYLAFCPKARKRTCGRVNCSIEQSSSKVVNVIDIENITENAAFCRCWRTKNWPYCDGSHAKHNADNNDNLGPLVINKNN